MPAPQFDTPWANDVSNQYGNVYDIASGYLDSPTVHAGQDFIQGNLNDRNFNNTNDYFSDLYGRLEPASMQNVLDLYGDFLGLGPDGSYGSGGGGGGIGSDPRYVIGGGGGGGASSSVTPPPRPDMYGRGGELQDVLASDTAYARYMTQLMDRTTGDVMDDPRLQALIDAATTESREQHDIDMAALSALAEGRGRFGGGLYTQQMVRGQEEFDEAISQMIASTYISEQARRDALASQNLQQILSGGLALTGDLSQRYGIDMSADTARYQSELAAEAQRAAAGASARNAQMQYDLATRGQDLQALRDMMGMNQFGLSMIGNIGQAWQNQQMGSMNAIPALESASMMPIQYMLGATDAQANLGLGLAGIDAQMYSADQARRAAIAPVNWAREQYYSPDAEIARALQMLQSIGAMGGQMQAPYPTQPNYGDPFGVALGTGTQTFGNVYGIANDIETGQ